MHMKNNCGTEIKMKKLLVSALLIILNCSFVFAEFSPDFQQTFIIWAETACKLLSVSDNADTKTFQEIAEMFDDLNFSDEEVFPDGKPETLTEFQTSYLNISWMLAERYYQSGAMAQALPGYISNCNYHQNPSSWVFTRYASVLDRTGKRAEAKDVLLEGLKRLDDPEKPNVFWDLCMYEYYDGNYEGCLKLAEEYLKLGSSVPGAFIFASLSSFAVGRPSEALGWFTLCLAETFNNSEYQWFFERLRGLYTEFQTEYGEKAGLSYVFTMLDLFDNQDSTADTEFETNFVSAVELSTWKPEMLKSGVDLFKKADFRKIEDALLYEEAGRTESFDWEYAIYRFIDLKDSGRFLTALRWGESAAEIALKDYGEKNVCYTTSLIHIALVYEDMGRYAESEPLYRKVLEITAGSDSAGLKRDYSTALHNLASLYFEMGQYGKAEPLFMEALKIRIELEPKGYSSYYASTLNGLALLYQKTGRFAEAELNCIKALEIRKTFEPSEMHSDYALSLNNLATLYYETGRYAEAEPLLKKAVGIQKEQVPAGRSSQYALALNNLAFLYYETGFDDDARILYEQSLEISAELEPKLRHPVFISAVANLAGISMNLGEYEESEQLYKIVQSACRKLEPVGRHPDYADILNNTAVLYERMKRYSEAASLYRQSISIVLDNLDLQYMSMSEKERAQYQSTVSLLLLNLKKFTEDAYSTVPATASFLFDTQIRTKGALLRSSQQMRSRIMESNDSGLISDYKRWLGLKEQYAQYLGGNAGALAGLTEEELKSEINFLEKDLSRESSVFARESDKIEYSWQDIRNVLNPDEAAVEILRYPYGDDVHYAALVITSDSKEQPLFQLMKDGSYIENEAYSAYREWVAAMESGEYSFELFNLKENYGGQELSELHELLYEAFWESVESILPEGVKTVFLSPDGVYNLLNLQTLKTPEGDYLSDRYAFRIVTNSREIVEQYDKTASLNSAEPVLVGYPDYYLSTSSSAPAGSASMLPDGLLSEINTRSGGSLEPLAGSAEEMNGILEILEEKNIEYFELHADEATENAVKSIKNPEILHITTHGFFLTDTQIKNKKATGINTGVNRYLENPLLRSGLYLAGAGWSLQSPENTSSMDDGILTAYEVMNLDLYGTKLVTLSACETGLGKVVNGEGVYGLQRAFLSAGADAVLMSLWKVDDSATKELMVSFYRHLYSGEETRTAYNMAISELREKYEDAYYWGAFILVE